MDSNNEKYSIAVKLQEVVYNIEIFLALKKVKLQVNFEVGH